MRAERQPVFLPSGDRAMVVEFGAEIDPEINALVHRTTAAIEHAQLDGVIELVPTYRSLMLHYDPLLTRPDTLQQAILSLDVDDSGEATDQRIVEIPTLYGGEYGPDIGFVAENAGMSESEVIEIHSGMDYLVYAMGFSPGFPYLGGLDPRLNTPRLTTPRTLIPGGSVGIAETQTGAYPVASPGGWQLIGRTPLKLFDPESDPPAVINAGDRVRFVPLPDEDAYAETERQVQDGIYSVVTRKI
ncbi:MAG: 5-oxoprolinase subunit PxpB [Dehalococcoidia bacterium]|nr:5-oxoprolinase subunit PxpB [Dehalococcoidia bacterium]